MNLIKRKSPFLALSGFFGILMSMAWTPGAMAMPHFARQYGVDCTLCHTVVPKLTKVGYEFRRAGFRMPAEIGESRDIDENRGNTGFNLGNYYSARLQMNASYFNQDHSDSAGVYRAKGDKYDTNQIEFKEFTLYPLTGAFLGHWGAMSEISGNTDEIEVENAYIRYVNGDDNFFWEARIGVFHPFEGFAASDRPLGLSRPLIQSASTENANGHENGWHPWGYDQTGVEAGISYKNTSLSLAVFNGLIEDADDPAQGGKLKKAAASPTQDDKDLQVFFNQFFWESGAAISAYYYNGRISLSDTSGLYDNRFQRYAVYANFQLQKLNLLGGFSGGQEKDDINNAIAKDQGWFVEANGIINYNFGIGARYDYFDSSNLIDDNNVVAASAFINSPLNNGIQFIAEYQYKKIEHGVDPSQVQNFFNLRMIYIW